MIGREAKDEKASGQEAAKDIRLKGDESKMALAAADTRAHGFSSEGPRMRFSYANGDQPLEGYTIKRGVGIGGFGEVYFAVSDAGKEVALKRVQRNIDIELRGVRHCLNLKSPHLVALYDIRRDQHDDVWIIMEYVHGQSLKDVIDAHPSGLPPAELKRWFTAIVEGVHHLHSHGIVHRDLKPANIFDDDGAVKVGDYGLSKFISCSRRDGHTESVGTIHYMAPEIGKGEYGKEIDVYALGVILYEMATGDVPFNGESAQEILFKHLTTEPDLSRLEPRLRAVVARCLHKDPKQRYQNVRDLLTAIEGLPVDEQIVEAEFKQQPLDAVPPPTPGKAAARPGSAAASEPAAAPVSPMQQPAVTPTDPFAAAVGNGFQRFQSWWHTSSLGTPAKVAIVAGAVALALLNAEWLVPTVLVLSTLYVLYLAARALSLPGFAAQPAATPNPMGTRQPPGAASPPSAVSVSPAGLQTPQPKRPKYAPARNAQHRPPRQARDQQNWAVRRFLASQPLSARMASLIVSALMAAGVCTAMTLVATSFVTTVPLDYATAAWWAPVLWTTIVSTIGCWILLVLGKRWEGDVEEGSPRRFVQFFAGLLLGIIAYGLSKWLMFDLKPAGRLSVDDFPTLWVPDTMYAVDGTPLLAAFLVFFGSLLLMIRWWRLTDPLRHRGFRIGRVVIATGMAWLLSELWEFPQPWGLLVALNLAVGLQIASQWISPTRRQMIAANEVITAQEVAT